MNNNYTSLTMNSLVQTKVCVTCGEDKSVDEFYVCEFKDERRTRLYSYCKPCARVKASAYYQANSDKILRSPAAKAKKRKYRYGITAEQYDALLLEQDFACAICKRPETVTTKDGQLWDLSVDHDHATGEVRALTCIACNALLGHCKEDIERLKAAIRYLETHQGGEN